MSPVPSQTLQWARLSGLRAGTGLCTLYQPESAAQLLDLLPVLRQPYLLGQGFNLVGSDSSDLTAIRLSNKGEFGALRHLGEGLFEVGPAMSLGQFLRQAAGNGYGGAAELSGIPGSLGGVVRMNAGARGKEISSFLRGAEGICLTDGSAYTLEMSPAEWSYRTSPVPPKVLLTKIFLQLSPVAPATELEAIHHEQTRRLQVTPAGASCGSIFRNPSPEQPAGLLLETAGCKGMQCGAFSVSFQHANWIVNLNRQPAPAKDFHTLLQECQRRVFDQYGIALHPEVIQIDQP